MRVTIILNLVPNFWLFPARNYWNELNNGARIIIKGAKVISELNKKGKEFTTIYILSECYYAT